MLAMNVKNARMFTLKKRFLILIILTLPSLSGCLIETMSVIGAGASSINAYYEINEDDTYTVISKDCLWYRKVKLSEEGKAGLTRDDREQLAYNNLSAIENCKIDNNQ